MNHPLGMWQAMRKTLMMTAIAAVGAVAIHAQDIAGDWQGTLKAGTVELRIVLHIANDGGGGLKGSVDSPDQGANGIPVSSISLKDTKLTFSIDSARGSYEGNIKPDGTLIEGTWSQGRPMPLDFKRASLPAKVEHRQAKPSDIDGYWMGALDTKLMKLRAVFHITNTEDGLVATLSSPDEGVMETPVAAVTRTDSSLRLEVKQIGATFAGKIVADLATIDGTWTTGAGSWPLVLKRVTEKEASERRRRPQEPIKPYPYREEEVEYANKTASVRIAGTLTIPPGKGLPIWRRSPPNCCECLSIHPRRLRPLSINSLPVSASARRDSPCPCIPESH